MHLILQEANTYNNIVTQNYKKKYKYAFLLFLLFIIFTNEEKFIILLFLHERHPQLIEFTAIASCPRFSSI